MSGVPSPPRADFKGPSTQRTGRMRRVGGRMLALMVVGEGGVERSVVGGVWRGGRVNY